MNAYPLGIGDILSAVSSSAPVALGTPEFDADLAALFASALAKSERPAPSAAPEAIGSPAEVPREAIHEPVDLTPSIPNVTVVDVPGPLPMATSRVDDLETRASGWLAPKDDPAPHMPALQSGRTSVVPLRTVAVLVDRQAFEQLSRGVSPGDLVIPVDLDIPEHTSLTGEFRTPAGHAEAKAALPAPWPVPHDIKGPGGPTAKIDLRALGFGLPQLARDMGRGPAAPARASATPTDFQRGDVSAAVLRSAPILSGSSSLGAAAIPDAAVAALASTSLDARGVAPARRSVAPLDFGSARAEKGETPKSEEAKGVAPRGIMREAQVAPAPVAALSTVSADLSGSRSPAEAVTAMTAEGAEVSFTVQNWQPGRPVQQMRIALEPSELGSIQIHFRQRGDRLFARIIASRPEAMPFIRANLDQLRATLAERGIQFGGFSLTAASALTAAGLPPEGLGLSQGFARRAFETSTAHDEQDLQEESIAA